MKLYNRMYIRGIQDRKVMSTIRKMRKEKSLSGLYCVTLPVFEDGILEIYQYSELLRKAYSKLEKPVVVIGIAGSRDDAKEMVCMIIDEVFQNSGSFDVEGYLDLRR